MTAAGSKGPAAFFSKVSPQPIVLELPPRYSMGLTALFAEAEEGASLEALR